MIWSHMDFSKMCTNWVENEKKTEIRIALVSTAQFLTGLILGVRLANVRRCYFVTTSLVDWTQT